MAAQDDSLHFYRPLSGKLTSELQQCEEESSVNASGGQEQFYISSCSSAELFRRGEEETAQGFFLQS